MRFFRLLFFSTVYFFVIHGTSTLDTFFDNQHVYTVSHKINTKRTIATFLADNTGKIRYLVKQIKDQNSIGRQMRCIREVLGTYVAHSINILSQNVFLIPSGINCIGKVNKYYQATLHTIVPGRSILRTNWSHLIQIKQYWFGKKNKKDEECGLSIDVVKSFSHHPDLSRIAALDTYVGNIDRSRNNIFYHKKRNRFWVIDMDCAFDQNLCKAAIIQIKRIKKRYLNYLTTANFDALQVYRDTLKKLICRNPPSVLKVKMEELAIECFGKKAVLKNAEIRKHLNRYGDVIDRSYKSAKKLVKELGSIFITRPKTL